MNADWQVLYQSKFPLRGSAKNLRPDESSREEIKPKESKTSIQKMTVNAPDDLFTPGREPGGKEALGLKNCRPRGSRGT